MNIQIYGKAKCFDTQKAQRYFKERGIKFQFIDVPRYGIRPGELRTLKAALGGLEALIDPRARDYDRSFIAYLASEEAKEEKLAEYPGLFRTPIVRNGRQATVGYCPDVWEGWA